MRRSLCDQNGPLSSRIDQIDGFALDPVACSGPRRDVFHIDFVGCSFKSEVASRASGIGSRASMHSLSVGMKIYDNRWFLERGLSPEAAADFLKDMGVTWVIAQS